MVFSREEAVRRAGRATRNVPGTCQKWTREIFGAPSVGDRDRDGDADAVDGWRSEPEPARHTDRKPPAGTPVAWSGGSRGYGHRAVSLGPIDGVYMVRSTDAPYRGKVGTVRLDWFEQHWGLTYLGWSETISGLIIPVDKPTPVKVVPKSKGEFVDAAIIHLDAADGTGRRGRLIRKARKLLRKIDDI